MQYDGTRNLSAMSSPSLYSNTFSIDISCHKCAHAEYALPSKLQGKILGHYQKTCVAKQLVGIVLASEGQLWVRPYHLPHLPQRTPVRTRSIPAAGRHWSDLARRRSPCHGGQPVTEMQGPGFNKHWPSQTINKHCFQTPPKIMFIFQILEY